MITGALVLAGLWIWLAHPTTDAIWSPDGQVIWVLPSSDTSRVLALGDRVLSVNGQSPERTGLVLSQLRAGDRVDLTLERDHQPQSVSLILRTQSAAQIIVQTGVPWILAMVFWAIGAVVIWPQLQAEAPSGIGTLAGSFFMLAGVELALGSAQGFAPGWIYRVYSSGLWILGPLGTWLHLVFPVAYRPAVTRWLVPAMAGIGLGGIVWGLLAPADYLGVLNATAHQAGYVWLALHILASIGLLIWSWWRHPTAGERRQLGVVALGAALSLGPLLAFSLAPRVLGRSPGDDFALVPLALLPATYGYAIYRFRRLAQDQSRILMRVLYYAFGTISVSLVVTLILALPVIHDLTPDLQIWLAIVGSGLLLPGLMRLIDLVWSMLLFGRPRQPLRQAATAIGAIDLSIEAEDLGAEVTSILRSLVGIQDSAVLVLNAHHRLLDVSPQGQAQAAEGLEIRPGSDVARLIDGADQVLEFDDYRDQLTGSPARVLLGVPWAQAVLPLNTEHQLMGILLIGYRDQKPFFDEEDILVLRMIGKALATAVRRRTLVRELKDSNLEAKHLSQELIRVREAERKRIARDLHDEIIQNLIAISYSLALVDTPPVPDSRQNLMSVIERARTLCFDLRQFQLDNLGLSGAVRHIVGEISRRQGRRIETEIQEAADAAVPEGIATELLAILEEALSNAIQHASAAFIKTTLHVSPSEVCLKIRDNGRGFEVTEARKTDATHPHFGLATMEERAVLVGGAFSIWSAPGAGTEVVVRISLSTETGSGGNAEYRNELTDDRVPFQST